MKKNPQSWFDVVKEKIQSGADRLNISMDSITESAIAFGVGFAAGYLTKKFGRSLLFLTIILVALLVVLHYVSIITIDWPRIKTMVGLSPDQDFQEAVHAFLNFNHLFRFDMIFELRFNIDFNTYVKTIFTNMTHH